jgi:hypothetical protein
MLLYLHSSAGSGQLPVVSRQFFLVTGHWQLVTYFQGLLLKFMVEMSGIEPLTPCLQGRCSPS